MTSALSFVTGCRRASSSPLQRPAQVVDRDAVAGEGLRVEQHANRAGRRTDGVDVARARDALELGLQRVRDLAELVGPDGGVLGPERHGDDRTSSMPLGLTIGWRRRVQRQPVLLGEHLAVESDDGVGLVSPTSYCTAITAMPGGVE